MEVTEADEHPSQLACDMIKKLWPYCHTAIQVDPYRSIYRVPPNIRKGDPAAYEPQIISIGPYHRSNPKLHAMEDHKWRYLHKLLVRKPPSDRTKALEVCIEKVRRSEARARRWYSEPIDLGSDDFVKMMVLDGCFVVELLLTFDDRKDDDPIYAVAWMLPLIWSDLFKLENQIPFFIIEDLFSIAAGPSVTDWSLRELAFSCLMMRRAEQRCFMLGISTETSSTLSGDRIIYHLLHFYTLVLLPSAENTDASITRRSSFSSVQSILKKVNPFISSSCVLPISDRHRPTEGRAQHRIPCVVELGEAGIKCRRKPEANTFLDVTFSDGMLDIPPVVIDDSAGHVTRNFIAFEQCCPNAGDHFAIYNLFLACVANTAKDVAILQQCGIIENRLGCPGEVALLLKQVGKEVSIRNREHYLAKVFEEVNEYCESRLNKQRAVLKRDYFSNPWAGVSVVAATALLLMTLLQVIYVVLNYYRQQTP